MKRLNDSSDVPEAMLGILPQILQAQRMLISRVSIVVIRLSSHLQLDMSSIPNVERVLSWVAVSVDVAVIVLTEAKDTTTRPNSSNWNFFTQCQATPTQHIFDFATSNTDVDPVNPSFRALLLVHSMSSIASPEPSDPASPVTALPGSTLQ